jgi:hypothetical protein
MKISRDDILALGQTTGERMMIVFRAAVKSGKTPTPEVLAYFETAFQKIQDGESLKKALGLDRNRGRKNPTSAKECSLYLDIALAVRRYMENGFTYEKAVEEAAREKGISFKTAQRHYGKYKESTSTFTRTMDAGRESEALIELGRQAFANQGKFKNIFAYDTGGNVIFGEKAGERLASDVLTEIEKGLLPKK